MKTYSRFFELTLPLAGLAASFLAAGCGDETPPNPTPKIEIREEGALSAITLSNLGSVAVTKHATRVFRIVNTGDAVAKLQLGAELAALKVTAPFYLLDGGADGCLDQQELAATTGSCTIGVQFVPTVAGTFNSPLEINYVEVGGPEATPPALKTAVTLTGTGVLDCSVNTELAGKRADGVKAAQDQMAQDAIQGKRDGDALTEPDGLRDGYNDGYNLGYDAGYNGPEGYKKGYPIGYSTGLTRGQNDVASCNKGVQDGAYYGHADGYAKGKSQGYTDGYNNGLIVGKNKGYPDGSYDGTAVGRADGYVDGQNTGAADGYDDGYAAGDDTGYGDGYTDGQATCNLSKSLPGSANGVKPQALTPASPDLAALGGACYTQGYQATYSRQAYNDAYAAAKAANVPYQRGYQNGKADGLSKGTTAGIAKGYADGVATGDRDGFTDGAQQRYTGCYNAQYPTSYNAGYTQGYNERYAAGSSDGYTDGYNSSYTKGYNDGYAYGHAQTYNSGYGSTYQGAYDSGVEDGYNNGYDNGYDDGVTDCGDAAKTLGGKKAARKPVAKSKVKVRALRGTPTEVLAHLKDKKPLVSHYQPEAYVEIPAPKSVLNAWNANILNTDALRESLKAQSSEERINAFLTQQFKKLQRKH